MKLKNKIAVITGAGSGIGRESALLLADEGARVVVVDLDPGSAQQTIQAIRKAGGETDKQKLKRIFTMFKSAHKDKMPKWCLDPRQLCLFTDAPSMKIITQIGG